MITKGNVKRHLTMTDYVYGDRRHAYTCRRLIFSHFAATFSVSPRDDVAPLETFTM